MGSISQFNFVLNKGVFVVESIKKLFEVSIEHSKQLLIASILD